MMDDPKRLRSALGGASAVERELLEALPRIAPPEGEKARAWEALAAQVATATLVAAGASTAEAASGAVTKAWLGKSAIGSKVIAFVIAGGLTAGGGLWARSVRQETAPATTPPTAARADANGSELPAEAPATPSEEEVAREDPEQEDAAKQVTPSKPRRERVLKGQAALLRESALLKHARAQLRAGDEEGAQASLDRLAAEFPDGVLGQEREVLAIAVLSAKGDIKGAQKRARAFVQAHPQSPHSGALQDLLERR